MNTSDFPPPPDAGDDAIAAKHLPSLEQENKRAQLLEDMFVSTNRAGAGGTRVGSVGLRPNGMAGTQALDELTPGRIPAKPAPFTEELGDPTGGKTTAGRRAKIMLPRNFCPDCDRVDRPHTGGCVNVSSFDQPMPELNLKPNELMISYFCQDCLIKHRETQTDRAAELDVVLPQGIFKKKQIDNATRLVRVRDNTCSFIRANLHNPDIYPEGLPDATS